MRIRTLMPVVAGCLFAAAAQLGALPTGWLAKVEPQLVEALQAGGDVDFLVALDSRADLAMAEAAKGRTAKTAIVMQILQAHAASTQSGVVQELARRGRATRAFWIANVVAARGSLADVQALAQRAEVARIYLVKPELVALPGGVDGANQAQLASGYVDGIEEGNVRIHAPDVWALGFTGQGVVVGDHDIGVQWDHPALKRKYRGWNEAAQTASHDYNWRNAFPVDDYCPDPGVPCDSHGHGTHTTGTMVGDGGPTRRIGMAPDAKWIACRSLYDDVAGAGTVPTYLDCMEWMLAPYPIGNAALADPAKGPDVVNNSWGCLEACAPPVLKDVNDATYAAGIVQVASAGNDGQGGTGDCSTLAFPLGVYDTTFTVGASNTVNEGMAGFSSKGPVATDGSLRIKPNVVAPGVGTQSSTLGGGYASLSGTSMAAPHVAGLIALVMSAEPRLIGRVADVRALVERTANRAVATTQACGGVAPTTIPNNVFGYGRVDALAAVLARPQLVATVTAPAAVDAGTPFDIEIVLSQPATGKIDVTDPQVMVRLAPGLEYVSTDIPGTLPVSADAEGTLLQFSFAGDLAPGEDTGRFRVRAVGRATGAQAVSTVVEGVQVSPAAGGTALVDVRSTADTLPDAFAFVERAGVATSVYVTSEARTITGINTPVPVAIDNGGQYRINGGSWTAAVGQIAAGDTLAVRHVSAGTPDTAKVSTVTVGDGGTGFKSVTSGVDAAPAAFGFATQAGVARASVIESNVVTPSDYNVAVGVVAGPGAEYRINGGAWTAAGGSMSPGDTLQTRHTSSASALAYTKTYVKVGGVTGYFTTRTQ
jgi:serine protease AprX